MCEKIKIQNVFTKGYTLNWSEEVIVIKKVKNAVTWTYVINDHIGGEIVGTFYEKEFQNTTQKQLRTENVIKKKDDRPYVKWKGCYNSFNSWINMKDIV